MSATVPVFLKHTFLGKATQQRPYTARAHSRYIARRSATHYHHAENMPHDYRARQQWYKAMEDGLRRNGRTIDKFTVSVPHGVTQEHAAETLTRFGRELGQGRAPFEFSLQGWDSPNHHAHIIYVDRGGDGKRIYGTTDRDSTRGIKLRWEEVANATFAELGYDIRVKVRDGLEADVEGKEVPYPEAEHDRAQADQPDHADTQRPGDILPDEIPAVVITDPPAEDTREGEADMAPIEAYDDEIELEPTGYETTEHEDLEDPPTAIRRAYNARTELSRIHVAKDGLKLAEDRLAYWSERAADDATAASIHGAEKLEPAKQNLYQAQEAMNGHLTARGKMKGFGISVFGFALRTAARRQAEEAAVRLTAAGESLRGVRIDQMGMDATAGASASHARTAARDAEQQRDHIVGVYGSLGDMEREERMFGQTLSRAIDAVSQEQARAAYVAADISEDEFRAYLEATGNKAELVTLDNQFEGGASL